MQKSCCTDIGSLFPPKPPSSVIEVSGCGWRRRRGNWAKRRGSSLLGVGPGRRRVVDGGRRRPRVDFERPAGSSTLHACGHGRPLLRRPLARPSSLGRPPPRRCSGRVGARRRAGAGRGGAGPKGRGPQSTKSTNAPLRDPVKRAVRAGCTGPGARSRRGRNLRARRFTPGGSRQEPPPA